MSLSKENFYTDLTCAALAHVLFINQKISLSSKEMADDIKVTFFPLGSTQTDPILIDFSNRLKAAFAELGVKIIPFEDAKFKVSLKFIILKIYKLILYNFSLLINGNFNFFWVRGKYKLIRGIAVIATGDSPTNMLPMDYTISFKENPIITIIKKDWNLSAESSFDLHATKALELFSYYMTNIAICVNRQNFDIYTFNLSYPTFEIDANFKKHILNNLIPKIAAPVKPLRLDFFTIRKNKFDTSAEADRIHINDLVVSSPMFKKTNLFPKVKSVSELRFRNNFYRWAADLHLDGRKGMSFGFLAKQLPGLLSQVLRLDDFKYKEIIKEGFYKSADGESYVLVKNILGDNLVVKVPSVWLITSRSGADKTALNPEEDLIRMGFSKGRYYLDPPRNLDLGKDYRPSFDTLVIFSHAIANAIIASILSYLNKSKKFVLQYTTDGIALAHWHGYFKPDLIPKGWRFFGENNPPVSCSSPQAAVYALYGKFENLRKCLEESSEYLGDIHIEAQHGINITFPSLVALANHLLENPDASALGNKYWHYYSEE